jgi:large subunit ribosomal protein L21
MYAVIRAGGKQHKVKPGDVIEVELMHGHEGDVTFQPLLVVDDDGGSHFGKDVNKAVVKAKVVGEEKGDKVKIFKYRPKTGYSRRQGHRQMYTLIEIVDVALPGKRAGTGAKKAAEPAAEDIGAVTKAEEASPTAEEAVSEAAESTEAGPEAEVEGVAEATDEASEVASETEAEGTTEAAQATGETTEEG